MNKISKIGQNMILGEKELIHLFTESEWFNLNVKISQLPCVNLFQHLLDVMCMKLALWDLWDVKQELYELRHISLSVSSSI